MAVDIVETFETFNLVLILVAFAIFARLAIRGKSLGNFRFQLSIFLLIWVLSEIPHIAGSLGLIATDSLTDIGLDLHAVSRVSSPYSSAGDRSDLHNFIPLQP